jgi:aspartate/methionine/tyrosine aminotransferase
VHKLGRDNNIIADPDRNIIATMGSKQGLVLSLMALLDPGDEVIVEDPCFVSYQPEIRFCGGVPIAVPLRRENAFRWNLDELAAAITPRTKAILLCNPHNPTGVVLTEAQLDGVAQLVQERGVYVIADEIYERMPWGGRRHVSMASRPGMSEHTITLMGTTKGFSMGGWRVGFIHAPKEIISAMVTIQQHIQTSASSLAQAGAATAFGEPYSFELLQMWEEWERRCRRVVSEVNTIPGVRCGETEGGFYAWIDVSARGEKVEALAERLLQEQGIALVPGSAFGAHGEGYLRMTCVKNSADLTEGLVRLRRGLA